MLIQYTHYLTIVTDYKKTIFHPLFEKSKKKNYIYILFQRVTNDIIWICVWVAFGIKQVDAF